MFSRLPPDKPATERPCVDRVAAALSIAQEHGSNDGAHHKAWVIDQMVRHLLGKRYATWVAMAKAGEEGPDTYQWDEGIAP